MAVGNCSLELHACLGNLYVQAQELMRITGIQGSDYLGVIDTTQRSVNQNQLVAYYKAAKWMLRKLRRREQKSTMTKQSVERRVGFGGGCCV